MDFIIDLIENELTMLFTLSSYAMFNAIKFLEIIIVEKMYDTTSLDAAQKNVTVHFYFEQFFSDLKADYVKLIVSCLNKNKSIGISGRNKKPSSQIKQSSERSSRI